MLEARDISVRYGGTAVLTAANLSLLPGKITAIVGANGAGKTTLIKALNGAVPISAGEILLGGKPIDSLTRSQIAREVAVVAQETESQESGDHCAQVDRMIDRVFNILTRRRIRQ